MRGWKERFTGSGAAMAGLVLINVLWGASSIAVREALLQLSAVEIVTIRFAIAAAAVFLIALAFDPGALRVRARDLPMLALLSVAGVSLQFVLQVTALVYTTVTNFSLLFNLSALFIIVLGAVLLRERLTGRQLAGAGAAFAGVFLIVTGGHVDLSAAHLPGDLIGLASAALFGVYTIAAKDASRRHRPLTVLAYTFFFGLLGLLPFYCLATPMTPLARLDALSWASLIFLALGCSVFAFFVYNAAIARVRAADAALTVFVTPLAGVTLAAVLLGEALTVLTVAGAGLILAGMYAAQTVAPARDGYVTRKAAKLAKVWKRAKIFLKI